MQDRDIQNTPVGKVLGLTITSTGYTRHYKQRQNIARAQLGLLYRFRNLNKANKRKLYLTLVRSKLIYPTIPTHTASKNAAFKLTKNPKQGKRFITGFTLNDCFSSKRLHIIARIEPINTTLHE